MLKEITIHDHTFEPYISREELDEAIKSVASRINEEYSGKEAPVFMITLSGAMFYAAELLKKLDFQPVIGFVKCSSYANGLVTSGKIDLKIKPTVDVRGKDVIVIEDIVDTGLTWKYLHKYLQEIGARRVRIATMCIKRDTYRENIPINWVSLEIENIFVVGMGLDYGELGRNLPSIYKLKK